ncbi:hypothetical protein ACQP1G_01425 [Nocardia sp. CA-107356]|uniref:hypothetical protein n=1 Tax=Nocardia sp. CA-107356 TaxID=3239972 RepID=UPI003D91C72A
MARRSMGSKWDSFGAHLDSAPGRLPVEVRRSIRARVDGSAMEDGSVDTSRGDTSQGDTSQGDTGQGDTALGATLPDELAAFVDLVAERSYRITEKNITTLSEAGHSDDEIFEAAIVAAYGAADRRYRAARRCWEGL